MFDIIGKVIKSCCHSFYKYDQKRDQTTWTENKAKLAVKSDNNELEINNNAARKKSTRLTMYEQTGESAMVFMQKQH